MGKKLKNKKKIAYYIGRFNPAHEGHILVLLWLLFMYDEVIIGLGSCYEAGSPRHPLLAVFREKMILMSLADKGVDLSRVKIVHLQDFHNDWDGWWAHINNAPGVDAVTHFVTGNEADILRVIEAKGLVLPFQMINPEKEMPASYVFPYHASEMREAIKRNDYKLFLEIAASGTVALMGSVGGFGGIRLAMENARSKFIPGRQTVDMVVTTRDKIGKKYVLCGYRKPDKADFPGCLALPGGGIDNYESPLDAVVRETEEETGVKIKILNRYLEPCHVMVEDVMSEMRFVKLYSTPDVALGGSKGGSSQLFMIRLDASPEYFAGKLRSDSDLLDVRFRPVKEVLKAGLAFQQTLMLRRALGYQKEEV